MELRQLRYFVAVAEAGNISRAAKRIFLTQPALSRQIQGLEHEIGLCLLERQAHSIRLTPAGETLLHDARELLAHADAVLERIRATGRGVRLRIGYAPSLAAGILSTAVQRFTQAHPTARVELFDLSSTELRAGLENDRLDVALTVGEPKPSGQLTWTPLTRAPWRVAISRNHPWANGSRRAIGPAEIAAESLLILNRRDYPEYWALIAAWLREHGQRARIAGEHDGAESLLAAVESRLGIALVTPRTPDRIPPRVRLKPLASPPPPLCIAAGQRADRTAELPIAEFVAELRRAAAAGPNGRARNL